jgi:hypothetical protein
MNSRGGAYINLGLSDELEKLQSTLVEGEHKLDNLIRKDANDDEIAELCAVFNIKQTTRHHDVQAILKVFHNEPSFVVSSLGPLLVLSAGALLYYQNLFASAAALGLGDFLLNKQSNYSKENLKECKRIIQHILRRKTRGGRKSSQRRSQRSRRSRRR